MKQTRKTEKAFLFFPQTRRTGMPRVQTRVAKSILTRTKIAGGGYALNPYVGCTHGCRYCYVRLMQRFFGHEGEKWGSFVDIKINAPLLLARELGRKNPERVRLGTATDPYQPLEAKEKLTRSLLEMLVDSGFPLALLTKSPLILRDLDLLREVKNLSVGITITTDREEVRKVMEPAAPSISARLAALRNLARAGLSPYAFVGPALPMNPEKLARALEPMVSHVYIDRLNYPSLCRGLLRAKGWSMVLEDWYPEHVVETFSRIFGEERVESVC